MRIKTTYYLIAVAALSAGINACKKEAETCEQLDLRSGMAQGEWKHIYPEKLEPDFSHPQEYRSLRFKEDSFFLQVVNRSDYIETNGCNHVYWLEYSKGLARVSGDTLILSGVYTEADHSVKTSGCYNIGAFNARYKAGICNGVLKLDRITADPAPERDRHIELAKQG